MDIESQDGRGWPLRAWATAAAGALVGLAIHALLPQVLGVYHDAPPSAVRWAAATGLGVTFIAAAFTVERAGHLIVALFAVLAGLVMGSAVYWNAVPGPQASGDTWRIACAAVAVAVAAPLFQAWRDGRAAGETRRFALPYVEVHRHAWTNTVLWCAAWTFTGISWLLAQLLAELFSLIGITLLRHWLQRGDVASALTGLTLGAGIGLLRDRVRVLGLVQNVIRMVLSVLTPVLAVGLVLFLAALPVTGLVPLWKATRSTTPILLSCVIAALILINAVVADRDEDESRARVLR